MRLYIYKITKHTEEQRSDTFDFTKAIAGAWHWATKEEAESACRFISAGGITVEPSFGNGAPCTDFRVEQRPEGGFAISCEHPFANE